MTTPARSTDEQLRFAIANKRLVQFRYSGSQRVAEPHDYGVQNGAARLLAYQRSGPVRPSRGGGGNAARGWRLLDCAKIEAVIVLDETFAGSRGRDHRQHLAWDDLYIRVE